MSCSVAGQHCGGAGGATGLTEQPTRLSCGHVVCGSWCGCCVVDVVTGASLEEIATAVMPSMGADSQSQAPRPLARRDCQP
jgi:hypothetical protein